MDAGADIKAELPGQNGFTVTKAAAKGGHAGVVWLLLKAGGEPTKLQEAVRTSNEGTVKSLLENLERANDAAPIRLLQPPTELESEKAPFHNPIECQS